MGFIRRQEEKLAARLIQWHQQQQADAPLSPGELSQKASLLVDEAHRVARHRGQNVLAIMKEMVADVLKK
ncbi:MAG: hypothetical protein KQI78_17065 [Deltaproteobacteria bacterium]|jgi:hypothetical protein|nr:hypothetical protein [Deltaproteobacteria bacterium]